MRLYQLSVRPNSRMSRLPDDEVTGDVDVLGRSRRAVILIHGFANSPKRADRSYAALAAGLEDCLPPCPERFATYFRFYWPGDHPLPVFNQATFSTRVPSAQLSGAVLAETLAARLPPDAEVILVAHSLGCRVALSALRWLRRKAGGKGPRVGAVFLLAAAVPVRDCHGQGDFAGRLSAERYQTMYSHRDMVLALAFPPGQLGFDWLAEAVGRRGAPERDRWDLRFSTGLGHSGYWRSPGVAQAVGRAISPLARYLIPELPLATDPPTPEDEGPAEHELPTRAIRSRPGPCP
ncbi:MAG: alpha/beta hydrolase [Actinobacteria bacterium]|nr:MAG: alpha/beta hydrolase [Actinomycetota bacterium]